MQTLQCLVSHGVQGARVLHGLVIHEGGALLWYFFVPLSRMQGREGEEAHWVEFLPTVILQLLEGDGPGLLLLG